MVLFILQIMLYNTKEVSTMSIYEKRGYLNSEFQLFHLTDAPMTEFEFHYHDFDKIVLFISGKVNYMIEGKTYELKPYDIVFVNHNAIHRPEIDVTVPYERIIVYISPNFIKDYRTGDYDLSYCFQKAQTENSNVLRMHTLGKTTLFDSVVALEQSFSDSAYASSLYRQLLFLEFMIHLNRAALSNDLEYLNTSTCNSKIMDLLAYINEHLAEDLSIDHLAQTFYISRYHMMRLFKEEMGYTIGNYISYKRLSLAKELIEKGMPVTQACLDCGFKDYSTFSRAYKKRFGHSVTGDR